MIDPGLKQQILDDLDRMSPNLQKRARELVHDLAVAGERPPSRSGKDLLRVAGTWDEETGREVAKAIEDVQIATRGRHASEWVELLRSRPQVLLDEGFGDDLLQILAEESPEERPSWDS